MKRQYMKPSGADVVIICKCKRVPPAQVSPPLDLSAQIQWAISIQLGRKGCVQLVLALKEFTRTAGHGMAEDPLPVRLYHKEPLTDF